MTIHHPSPALLPPRSGITREEQDATPKSISPALEAGALQRQRIVSACGLQSGEISTVGRPILAPIPSFSGPTPRRWPAVHSAGKGHSRSFDAVAI